MIDTKIILTDPETGGCTMLRCTLTGDHDAIHINYPDKREGFIMSVPLPAIMAMIACIHDEHG